MKLHTYIHTYIHKKIKLAFTLAEVLIVLGIIGIIAEMTIPTLMNNVQDAQYKSGAKKAYSVASQAVEMMIANGNSDFSTYASTERSFKADVIGYFRVIKDCNWDDCTSSITYKTLAGGTGSKALMDDGQFITADGMIWGIENYNDTCLAFCVDVNGAKKPNTFGKDVFMFQISSDGTVKPMGVSGSYLSASSYCVKSSSNELQGLGCMYDLMQDISYD